MIGNLCPLGYPMSQLESDLAPDELEQLVRWLQGWAATLCDTSDPLDACGEGHGFIAYSKAFDDWIALRNEFKVQEVLDEQTNGDDSRGSGHG